MICFCLDKCFVSLNENGFCILLELSLYFDLHNGSHFENIIRLIRFLRSSSSEGDLMMDSAIEISSSSSECSDDESPEPIREEVRTRRNPSWLGGIVSCFIFVNLLNGME